ncbi:helix-turn-helix transcriptional regulator [Paenibacillus polysaccharolyticus]|uniref:helix-turn-helix domain-containing protein n=1 Tax=Paenibacillus polysaccharolyticus TaxID=582692 RepID=UPI00203CE8B1|nr:helix-turn-helix transcriptional regulator [Paenibacillus polysaccharolyticus]MCM3136248.1 helix-turn-helix transcriptional regulator [Paenibacillus polysaccharolyticus]
MNNKKGTKRIKSIVLGRVKELREENNLSQLEFAESIDVSSNTISRIERREMSLSSDIALKIGDIYGVSLDWLFFRGDEKLSPKRQVNLQEAFNCMQESISTPIRLKINKKTPSD